MDFVGFLLALIRNVLMRILHSEGYGPWKVYANRNLTFPRMWENYRKRILYSAI